MHLLSILPATGIANAFTYKSDDALEPGTYVKISFGRQEVAGVVWATQAKADIPESKIKSIREAYDAPPLPQPMRDYIDRVAGWTMTPRGLILKMVIPNFKILETPKKPLSFICSAVTGGGAVMLSDDQGQAARSLRTSVGQGYHCTLLDGVTGSGKTEVYFEAVAEAIHQGFQALIMMPEIALTAGFMDRFEKRFGVRAALWHSQMTPKQRQTVWQGVAQGITKAVIGARSSLFLPYRDLGLIVVDEEHDPSYKQEEQVIYHARDMAVLRGALLKHGVILASATPSVETLWNVQQKRYNEVKLPDRYGGAQLPDIHLVDMRDNKPASGEFISPVLNDIIESSLRGGEQPVPAKAGKAIHTDSPDTSHGLPRHSVPRNDEKKQTLLFLNRRGYAPLTLCRSCGARLECPQCTAWLVQHKNSKRTFCHHCDYGGATPTACPACGAEDSLVPIGPGVERIAEEVKTKFPEARTMILSSDVAEEGGLSLQDKLQAIQDGEVDIIIGTQMIAKGHHFPYLTTVGVIDADLALKGGDLRAGERTWQLLHQVAGRAGREVLQNGGKGQVYIQTYMAESPLMQALAAHDREGFIATEMEGRRLTDMPPFSRMAGIILSGKNEQAVQKLGQDLARTAPRSDDFIVMGPAIPPFAMLRGRHRRRLLVQAARSINLQKTIAEWLAGHDIPSSLRLSVDIDPQSFL